ncbi:hypothetical protein BOX15_Mlig032746g2 [Macrostomum lignano]|uniref:Vacuolar protein sorting-associated protein 26 n=1 Tax=Macrostomum lignano TaxID=282301 RepID=A0A267G1Z0_9PLAT|nr:hypothetical protein BOX15_Mlig032746g2 [Macrostomum lignano]
MSFFGFGPSAEIEILLDGSDTRKAAELKLEDGRKERFPLYYDGETVSGKVNVVLKKSNGKLEHQGIKIEFIGQIDLYFDRGNRHEFVSMVRELARPGILTQNASYNFEFVNVEKPYESYTGSNVKLRYYLRVSMVKRLSDLVKEQEICVHTLAQYPDLNSSIKMEVGIEDCLHIEFEYNKSKYHLKDVIVGKIYFLLVRIKIKHMEIQVIKREIAGSGPNALNENETLAKFEIMDGAPVRGESIPIRLFLSGYDLTPTMRDINKKFSVKYYLNLVLVDEEERRYFKQQEVTLFRKADKKRRPIASNMIERGIFHHRTAQFGGPQPPPQQPQQQTVESPELETGSTHVSPAMPSKPVAAAGQSEEPDDDEAEADDDEEDEDEEPEAEDEDNDGDRQEDRDSKNGQL